VSATAHRLTVAAGVAAAVDAVALPAAAGGEPAARPEHDRAVVISNVQYDSPGRETAATGR
jgi:hypothetical protein